MHAEAKQQKRPDGLCGRTRKATLVRHQAHDLLGDLSVFSHRAIGLKHRQNWLEGVAVDARYALDFLDPVPGMLVEILAGSVPVLSDNLDVMVGYQARDRFEAIGQSRRLPYPSRVSSGHAQDHAEHVHFPFGVESPPALAPLQVPVPYGWEH